MAGLFGKAQLSLCAPRKVAQSETRHNQVSEMVWGRMGGGLVSPMGAAYEAGVEDADPVSWAEKARWAANHPIQIRTVSVLSRRQQFRIGSQDPAADWVWLGDPTWTVSRIARATGSQPAKPPHTPQRPQAFTAVDV